MLNVKHSNQSLNILKRIDKTNAKQILNKIKQLRKKPIIHDSKRIINRNLFRIRVGKYRVLYEIDHENNILGIEKIDKRARVY